MHPAYRFENDQWFNIPEETHLQLTQMQRDYQSQKRQFTDAVSGTNSQYQQQIWVQQTYLYYQPVHETIFQLPPQLHGSVSPYSTQKQIEISQTNQQPHDDEFSAMTHGTRGASIMGGQNQQSYLRSKNTNGRNISGMNTHRRVGCAKEVTVPAPNTTGSNEADTNTDTCCPGQNFIPIVYTNWSEDVYPYSYAYEPIENVPIFLELQLTITHMEIHTSYYYMSLSIMVCR